VIVVVEARRTEERMWIRAARAGVLTSGAGLVVLVARDGSPGWQVVRTLLVVGLVAGSDRVLRRVGDRAAALVAVVVGVLCAPVGVGIAVPHVAKAGDPVVAIAGLAVLGGSLVALVAGATGLWATTRRRWRAPVEVAVVMTAILSLWTVGQATAATNVPATELGSRTPAEAGIAYRDVTFRTADGVVLSGWYVPSRNGAAVVLAHGAGSTRSSVLDHAIVLAAHGYGALLFDARGHGRSDGRAMDFGWCGDLDIGGAVSFVAAQPDVDERRIAAVGLSMGGEEALGAAASDTRIAAVVAEGATGRTAADKAWLSQVHGWRGQVQEVIEHLLYEATDLLTDARPPITLRRAVTAAAPRPVFLIAAGTIENEVDSARAIESGSPQSVQHWIVPGAGHTDGLDRRPGEWERRVTAFLARSMPVHASD
jgi:dienelactone hydrolase